jgi:hypothetical protein
MVSSKATSKKVLQLKGASTDSKKYYHGCHRRQYSQTKNARFQERLLDLFAPHPVPFSLFESPKFQGLFEIYNINLPIKNRHSLSAKLKEPGFEIEENVKQLLSSDECVPLHNAFAVGSLAITL